MSDAIPKYDGASDPTNLRLIIREGDGNQSRAMMGIVAALKCSTERPRVLTVSDAVEACSVRVSDADYAAGVRSALKSLVRLGVMKLVPGTPLRYTFGGPDWFLDEWVRLIRCKFPAVFDRLPPNPPCGVDPSDPRYSDCGRGWPFLHDSTTTTLPPVCGYRPPPPDLTGSIRSDDPT